MTLHISVFQSKSMIGQSRPDTMHPKPARPTGITLLSVLFMWIGGFGTLVFPIFLFVGTGNLLAELFETQLHWSHALSLALATLVCTVWYSAYVLYLCIGIGLWKLKRMALRAIMAVQWFGIGMGVVASLVVAHYEPLLAFGVCVWCSGICGAFL